MTSTRAVLAAVFVFTTVLTTRATVEQGAPATPQPPAAPAGAGERRQVPPGAPGQGRGGGGRGHPAATLYTERCAGCHGLDMSGGRAPSLFDDVWLRGSDDETIARHISNGIPNTEMMAFKDMLTEAQIWQLVAYVKTQGANLRTKPTYVPDPDGQTITSEKQNVTIEIVARGLETPWALAFLPDGRLLATERPGRLRIVTKGPKGELLAAPVSGTPTVWERQDGGLFDVEVHPQYEKSGWIYLASSLGVAGPRDRRQRRRPAPPPLPGHRPRPERRRQRLLLQAVPPPPRARDPTRRPPRRPARVRRRRRTRPTR